MTETDALALAAVLGTAGNTALQTLSLEMVVGSTLSDSAVSKIIDSFTDMVLEYSVW